MSQRGQTDRGALADLNFAVCDRGFLLRAGSFGEFSRVFAFDRIEDLAEWMVEQYHDAHRPSEEQKACDE
jgi:hypothetical protein